jgi:nitroreductase
VLPLPREHLQGHRPVVAGPLEEPYRRLPVDRARAQREVAILLTTGVVVDVDMGQPVLERLQERSRAVGLPDTEPEVRVAHIEMETQGRRRLENRPYVLDAGEQSVEVLDHQRDPALGRIVRKVGDGLRVPRSDLLNPLQRHALIGMNVYERDPRGRKRVQPALEQLARRVAQLRKRRGQRKVIGRVPHGLQTEIAHQTADFLPIRHPRGRRFEGEIYEVEAVIGYAVDLLCHRAAWEVHCSDEHLAILVVDQARKSISYPGCVETYEAIMTRRSVPKTTEQVPDQKTIQRLLDAAVRAPNHHLTQPWRFIVLTGDALKEMGEAWATGAEREGKDPEQARDKPLRAPVIICVVERPKSHLPKVVEIEEHHAVGAALQNILLAAHDDGLGAMLRTGPAARLPEVREYLGVSDDELIAGFVYVGYPDDDERPAGRRRDATAVTEWRGWE